MYLILYICYICIYVIGSITHVKAFCISFIWNTRWILLLISDMVISDYDSIAVSGSLFYVKDISSYKMDDDFWFFASWRTMCEDTAILTKKNINH